MSNEVYEFIAQVCIDQVSQYAHLKKSLDANLNIIRATTYSIDGQGVEQWIQDTLGPDPDPEPEPDPQEPKPAPGHIIQGLVNIKNETERLAYKVDMLLEWILEHKTEL